MKIVAAERARFLHHPQRPNGLPKEEPDEYEIEHGLENPPPKDTADPNLTVSVGCGSKLGWRAGWSTEVSAKFLNQDMGRSLRTAVIVDGRYSPRSPVGSITPNERESH